MCSFIVFDALTDNVDRINILMRSYSITCRSLVDKISNFIKANHLDVFLDCMWDTVRVEAGGTVMCFCGPR